MRKLVKLTVVGLALLAVLQLVHPGIPSGPTGTELKAPPAVRRILEKDCYSCHSNERRLAWFDQIVPGYWLVRHDILKARERLNFSTLGSRPAGAQEAALFEAVNMIQFGSMPLRQFVALHPDAKVTPQELAVLKSYLAPWSTVGGPVAPGADVAAPVVNTNLNAVTAEFNGVPFQADFETWKPISFTDRGDNNTFRAILGNPIAMKALESGNVSPWPDGTRFAKIAWQQALGEDGIAYPGKFVQVEFMLKNAELNQKTEGWGFGRWRGNELKPYGSNAQFVTECTGCHEPMSANGFVYTLPINQAKLKRDEVVNNRAAGLPPGIPYQPLGWHVLTMFVDSKAHTMAALFGNNVAQAAMGQGNAPTYPAGSVLALVTWSQREDPHWFGGRIPDTPLSVDFVETDGAGKARGYRRYDGPSMQEQTPQAEDVAKRSNFLLTLAPAMLP